MSTHLIFVILIYVLLLFIVISLGTGLYYIVKPSQHRDRVAKALTTRISISIALLLIIAFAAFMGWFKPMSLLNLPKAPLESGTQTQTNPATRNPQNANTTPRPQTQNAD